MIQRKYPLHRSVIFLSSFRGVGQIDVNTLATVFMLSLQGAVTGYPPVISNTGD